MNPDKLEFEYLEQDRLNTEQVTNMQPMHNNGAQLAIGAPATVQITSMPNQPSSFRPVGPKSMEMTCPSCRCHIRTNVRHRSTAKTHIACLLLTGLCCCCLPYCMDTCRNANHFCPMCGTFLGTYSS